MATRALSEGRAHERLTPAASGNGFVREQVVGIQRARLIAAMSEVACEHGAANVTTAHVVDRAGVSRRTFYEIFSDCHDCFLASLDEALALASSRVLVAYETAGSWRERIRASLTALLRFLDEEPTIGRVLIVESLAAGPEALARRARALAQIVAAVDTGRLDAKAGLDVTPLTAEGVVGGMFAVIHARLVGGVSEPLVKLANPLMGMIVLPYLGRAAARQELSKPAPESGVEDVIRVRGNPLQGIPMRLTYRTVCVLQFIAATPGVSNREIGLAAEIVDQGQVSKLLARLQRLGLAQNTEPAPGMGRHNAWTLTPTGLDLERAMSANASQQSPS